MEPKAKENFPENEKYERCVICGRLTSVPVSKPIKWRQNYEIGCGQLCDRCVKK